jgi:hypothetical protein
LTEPTRYVHPDGTVRDEPPDMPAPALFVARNLKAPAVEEPPEEEAPPVSVR